MLLTMRQMFVATVLAMGITACSQQKNESTTNASDAATAASVAAASVAAQSAQDLPVYKIRTANQPYPPFNIYNPDNTITGLERDVLEAIAKNQGFKIQYEPHIWDLIFKDLKKNDISMVGGGLAKVDFDLEAVNLSQPYTRSPDCIVATSESNLDNWQKKKIALVKIDEVDDEMINNFGVLRSNIQYVRSQYQGLKQVFEGQTPLAMSDCYSLRYYINQSFQDYKTKFILKELTTPNSDDAYNLVIGVRKDQTELLQKINQGITNLKANGELDKILQQWQ